MMWNRSRFAAAAALAFAVSSSGLSRADDEKAPGEKPAKVEEKKPAFDPKEVRVGAPPELAELRKAVEEAAKKGENVEEIRKQLEALEKVLAGKPWVKPKPVEEPAAPPAFDPPGRIPGVRIQPFPPPVQLPGIDNPGFVPLAPPIFLRPGVRLPTGSRLGVRLEKVPAALADQIDLPAGRGVLVAEVVPDSAAEKAGLKANDIITEFAGKPVSDDPNEFIRTVFAAKAGEKVDVVYYRKGKKAEAKGIPLADADRRGRDLPLIEVEPLGPMNPLPGVRPLPLPLPEDGVQKAKSVSVQVRDGKFTLDADEDGVKFVMEGTVGERGKAVPTKIEIKDGEKNVTAESVEKLPADYRDRVQKILDGVKVGR